MIKYLVESLYPTCLENWEITRIKRINPSSSAKNIAFIQCQTDRVRDQGNKGRYED